MRSKIEILKETLDVFHRKYEKLGIRCAYERKINFYFIEVSNECFYKESMEYHNDIFDLSQSLFEKLGTYDILISEPDPVMRMSTNEILHEIEPCNKVKSPKTSFWKSCFNFENETTTNASLTFENIIFEQDNYSTGGYCSYPLSA